MIPSLLVDHTDWTRIRAVRWLRIGVIWLGVGVIDACENVFQMRTAAMHHNWGPLFVVLVLNWLPWVLATPLVMQYARRYRLFPTPSIRFVLMHLGLVLVIALTAAAWSALLEVFLDPRAQPQASISYLTHLLDKLSYGLLTSLIVYTIIQCITLVMDSLASQHTEAANLNEQLTKVQLDALRRQIDPHSMFNTLNAIAGLVRNRQNDAAIDMIVGLSTLLRRSVQDMNSPQVTLGEEIAYLQCFLAIQRARFAERLCVDLDVPVELHPILVPNMILQPLVENAIKHGIAKRIQGGQIQIVGRREGEVLKLSVFNDGPSFSHNRSTDAPGIALANLRARLRILYGSNFSLHIASPDTGGVEVAISLPVGRSQ
jgi:two-component system LytT family sensor kinase